MMKISIGSDHRGFALKQELISYFDTLDWIDVGTENQKRVDYPIYAQKVCNLMLNGTCDRGILLCGSGVGMAIAANRYKKIYAALCWEPDIAQVAREDDGCNVLVLPSDFVSIFESIAIVKRWLQSSFKGKEYKDRLKQIDNVVQ